MAGEALFNDGTALVLFQLFTDVLQTAAGSVSISHFMLTFARMAAGGVGVGFMSGLAGAVALGYTESGTLVRSRLWKVEGWVWKAATSKADPGQQQDWILKCLQDEPIPSRPVGWRRSAAPPALEGFMTSPRN